jgi:exopolyphosphatase/guanosine-5'-triphosphate,3'-diphosphate pyrophosphatase
MPVLAAIDVGTNTVRALVADAEGPGRFRPLFEDQAITRLGEGLRASRTLGREPIRRTVEAAARYAEVARTHGAKGISAVATAAARDARNGAELREALERAAGLECEFLSGEREAALMLQGVLHGLGLRHERLLVLDVGGGSTEVVLAVGGMPERPLSARLGVVALTERYLKSNPPRSWELVKLEGAIAEQMDDLLARIGDVRGRLCAGTAGTVTTLAAIDMGLREYDARRVTGYRLYRRRLTELYRWLARMTLESRRRVPGLEPGRADVIVAGAAIVLQAMETLGFSELKVSDEGLREGVLLDLMARVVGPAGPPGAPGGPGAAVAPAVPAPPAAGEAPAAEAVAATAPFLTPAAGVPVGGDSGEALPE